MTVFEWLQNIVTLYVHRFPVILTLLSELSCFGHELKTIATLGRHFKKRETLPGTLKRHLAHQCVSSLDGHHKGSRTEDLCGSHLLQVTHSRDSGSFFFESSKFVRNLFVIVGESFPEPCDIVLKIVHDVQ